jgi:hypothetical protein
MAEMQILQEQKFALGLTPDGVALRALKIAPAIL